MKIAIIVAMDKEFAQLAKQLDHATTTEQHGRTVVTGEMGHHTLILQQGGIGKVNAAICTVEMINRYKPELVISTGVAGGADPTLDVQNVVVGTEYAYHDVYCGDDNDYGQVQGMPTRYSAAACVAEAIDRTMAESEVTLRKGLIVSGDWFVNSREKMREIMGHFPEAQAVDMESCGIAQTCHIYGVPFVSMRIISDVPLRDDKAAMYVDFWDRLADNSFGVTRRFLDNIK